MKDRIKRFFNDCSNFDFGDISLAESQEAFYRKLNNTILYLCKSLPSSTQDDAMLYFMRYSGLSFDEDFKFFKNYYTPAWSIIYWLIESCPDEKRLSDVEVEKAIIGHAMAMTLHSLDDHLNDGEIPMSHLSLLLRSQAWMLMNKAFERIIDGTEEGKKIVRDYINEYYRSICNPNGNGSLDTYCDFFRREMTTGLIIPTLITRKIGTDLKTAEQIKRAFMSFGVAWRLLDDIKDAEADMLKGHHSAIYTFLPENIKPLWDNNEDGKREKQVDELEEIIGYILENTIIDKIKDRIIQELSSAAIIADKANVSGMADEFRCLLKPFYKCQGL